MYDTLQLSFLTTHYETTSNDYYTDESFPLYTVPQYIKRKKHPSHDNYLYRRWNNPTARRKKKTRTHTTNQRLTAHSTTKDDPSITPTLETLDTRSSDPTYNDTDAILNITIWNKSIVQYQMPNRSTIRNQSRHPSTAVQYALIGVYAKLLNPPNLPPRLLLYLLVLSVYSIILFCSFCCFLLHHG